MPEPQVADSQLTLLDAAPPGKTGVDDAELDKLRLALKERDETIAAERAEKETLRQTVQTTQRQVLQQADITIRSREAQIDTSLGAITDQLVTLEAQIADAQGRGDFKTSANLTVKVGELQARKVEQERFKSQIEGEKARLEKPQTGRIDGATYTDRNGTTHDLGNYHPETQRWIRNHPDFLTDPVFQQKVMRADAKAFGDGVERNTPEYFERVETEVGLRQSATVQGSGQEQEVVTDPPARQQQRSTSTAAPVSRTPSAANGNQKKTDLTAEEADAARISDPELFRKDPGACYRAYMEARDALKTAGRLH